MSNSLRRVRRRVHRVLNDGERIRLRNLFCTEVRNGFGLTQSYAEAMNQRRGNERDRQVYTAALKMYNYVLDNVPLDLSQLWKTVDASDMENLFQTVDRFMRQHWHELLSKGEVYAAVQRSVNLQS